MSRLRLLVLAAASVLVGCADSLPDDPTVEARDERAAVQTAALSVTARRTGLGWEADIPYTVRNVSAGAVHIQVCGGAAAMPAALERRVGDRWSWVWGAAVPLCIGEDVVVPADGSRGFVLRFFAAADPTRAGPAFRERVPARATYRLVLPGGRVDNGGPRSSWPATEARQLVSNPFTLELP